MIKKLIFILFWFFVGCSSDEEEKSETLYGFPPLSQGQLIDLKNQSEKIEGFFVTTSLSDLDLSWSERGFYIYVCIRFLNDQAVNNKLKKSAIPLLVQVSNHKDRPEAESLLLFHPETIKPDKNGVFYYEERQFFKFMDSPIIIRNKEYNIFDVVFNEKSKITEMFFVKKGVSAEELNRAISAGNKNDEGDDEEDSTKVTDDNQDNDENSGGNGSKKDIILGVTAFAKQFSNSCEDWAILNYNHSKELPDYLKVSSGSGDDGNAGNKNETGTGEDGNVTDNADGAEPAKAGSQTNNPDTSGIPSQEPIPEDAPHRPLPQN